MAASPEAVFAQGAAALEAGDFRAAERLFQQILASDPRAHPAWNALSVVAVRAGLPEIAVEHSRRALELDRRNPVYLNNLGVACGELGEYARAEEALRRALKAKPAYAEGHFNLGKVLHKLGRLGDALRAYERAYAIEPQFPGIRAALIHMYRKHGRADRALAVLKEAPGGLENDEFVPLSVEVLAELEGIARATAWLKGLMARHPDWHGARFTLAQLLLAQGHWREGWREYLWRPNVLNERVDVATRATSVPAVLPKLLEGKRARLRSEQGMGDNLFFLRFAEELRGRGASVDVLVPPKLAAVLPAAGPLRVLREDDPAVAALAWDHDLWIGDLPGLLESEAVPPAFPLVRDEARAARWRQRLAGLGPPPYLALTWRAGIDVLRNREFGNPRSFLSKEIPAAVLGAALRGWRGTLVSVQRDPLPGETQAAAAAAGAPLHDLSALNDELPEILAMLSVVEEYVCVSNTNVHLLAGIGRTARVLVPYPAEWRWMREGSSPWFPGFPMYREPQARGWEAPLLDLRKDLFP